MLAIRSIVSAYYTLLTSSITLNREIMSPCSCYIKKGLVYITITDLSGCQPSSCSKCMKLNTCVLYNMRLISLNKYIFFVYFNSL